MSNDICKPLDRSKSENDFREHDSLSMYSACTLGMGDGFRELFQEDETTDSDIYELKGPVATKSAKYSQDDCINAVSVSEHNHDDCLNRVNHNFRMGLIMTAEVSLESKHPACPLPEKFQ